MPQHYQPKPKVRVEFFGLSSAGKSTAYRDVLESLRLRLGEGVRTIHDVTNHYHSTLKRQHNRRNRLRLSLRKRETTPSYRDKFLHLAEEYHSSSAKKFIDFLLLNQTESGPFPTNHLMRHLWTLDTVYNFIAAEKIGWIGALIEDESILQRILGLSMHSKHPEKTLSRGVSSAPMPDIAVNVTAPPEVIKARAKARGDRAHINYDLPGFMDNSLDLNVRLKELISKNTRVISLDSSLQCYHVSIRSISQEILDSLLPQPSLRRTHLA